jgi:hypothetical protein
MLTFTIPLTGQTPSGGTAGHHRIPTGICGDLALDAIGADGSHEKTVRAGARLAKSTLRRGAGALQSELALSSLYWYRSVSPARKPIPKKSIWTLF